MLVDSLGHIIEVPDSTQQPRVFTLGEMKRQVAQSINSANDPSVRDSAGDGIRWAISYARITRHFMFGRAQTTVAPLVAESPTITLPTNFFGVQFVEVIYTDTNPSYPTDLSTGKDPTAYTLPNEPYSVFKDMGPDEVGDAPVAWSARNTFTDGYILIRPRPSTKAASDWKVRVVIDTPVSLPDSDTDVIAAPEDFSVVAVEGGKAYLRFERKDDDPVAYRHQMSIFETMIARYASHERARHGKKAGAWRIGEP